MAIDDLPLPVVNLLNVIGVPWPYLDEDTLQAFASLTCDFAAAVQTTHDEATQTIKNIAAAYRGSATDAMTSGWAKLSARHVNELLTACHVLADALVQATAAVQFLVNEVFGIATRGGLIAVGTTRNGEFVGIPSLRDAASGHSIDVLGVDHPTPRTPRARETILVVDRADAAYVEPGRLWTQE